MFLKLRDAARKYPRQDPLRVRLYFKEIILLDKIKGLIYHISILQTSKKGGSMFKIIFVVVFFLLVLGSFLQPCMAREFADIYTDCGLGAMIAPRNSAVAAVTNVTWDSGTTAISSNISCPDSCTGGQDRVAAFINDSYESLEKDLASGYGKYLDALTVLAGYDPQDKQEIILALRNDFTKLVADLSYTDKSRFEKAEALYNLVYKYVGGIS